MGYGWPWHPYPPCQSFLCETRKCCGGPYKFEWPELVGKDPNQAKAVIVKDNPRVAVVPERIGTIVIHDFCCNRVWLWLDQHGRVARVPMVG